MFFMSPRPTQGRRKAEVAAEAADARAGGAEVGGR